MTPSNLLCTCRGGGGGEGRNESNFLGSFDRLAGRLLGTVLDLAVNTADLKIVRIS